MQLSKIFKPNKEVPKEIIKGPDDSSLAIDLSLLEECYQDYIVEKGQQKVDIALVHARLADHYRDMALDFIAPKDFLSLVNALDDASQQRLALTVAGLDNEGLKKTFSILLKMETVSTIETCFIEFARSKYELTMELLQQSSLRVEEFARQFLAVLGADIEDETRAESKQRLERLDYRRLLKESERAKASAEERMDYLRQLREEQERRLGRRGKF